VSFFNSDKPYTGDGKDKPKERRGTPKIVVEWRTPSDKVGPMPKLSEEGKLVGEREGKSGKGKAGRKKG
jgi:hypothetical protein